MNGLEVRAIRERLGLTQPQFAERIRAVNPDLATTHTQVSRWESGTFAPSRSAQSAIRDLVGPLPGMDRHEMARIIDERGVMEIGDMVRDFAFQVVASLKEGWNFAGWEVNQDVPGVALFTRRPDPNRPATEGVMVVNADHSDFWEVRAAESPFPLVVRYQEVVR